MNDLMALFSDSQIEASELQLDDVAKKLFVAHNLLTTVQQELVEAIKEKAAVDSKVHELKSRKSYLTTIMHNLQQIRRHLDIR